MGLFPYEPRESQPELMELIRDTVSSGRHAIIESGTGSGKTVCSITAIAEAMEGERKKMLYLTRTNSQQAQVIREAAAIGRIRAVAIQGRANMCPLMESVPEFQNGTSEELAKLCRDYKKEGKCPYFSKTAELGEEKIREIFLDAPFSAEQLRAKAVSEGLCPYEVAKILMKDAELVTAPYIFFFNPAIRRALLDWMGVPISDIILVVDEAHNLPDYCREIESAELSINSLNLSKKEIAEFGDPEIMDGLTISDLVDLLIRIIKQLNDEYVKEDDSFIPPGAVMEFLMEETNRTSAVLRRAFEKTLEFGEAIREKKRLEKRLPRSYIHSLGAFMLFWEGIDATEYVKLIVGGEENGEERNSRLEAACLDPSLASSIINECSASIHISGTLAPLHEYRDSVGLPEDTVMARFPSPFPEENLKILAVDDVTTKYDEWNRDRTMADRIAGHIERISMAAQRNTGVFFPSYGIMTRVMGRIKNENEEIRIISDERGIGQKELQKRIDDFRRGGSGARLFTTVMGGRVSEGIDFPASEMEVAIIVGIPYPKPTAKQQALMRYYDIKFNKGWEYTVKAPAIRKVQQAIGRLIRRETDSGVAVILDKRAGALKEGINFEWTERPEEEVKRFFSD